MRSYCVYVLASLQRVLYIGITSNLEKRMWEHRTHKYPRSFTARYEVTRLVHLEIFWTVEQAIAREKELKGWRRGKKVRLVKESNPEWNDIFVPSLSQ
jgi:putative endonuclease